jgi:hypothetical protein
MTLAEALQWAAYLILFGMAVIAYYTLTDLSGSTPRVANLLRGSRLVA